MEAERDENQVAVLMLVDENTGEVVPALADHATGYLLVAASAGALPTIVNGDAVRDENRVTALLAEDETTGDYVPVLGNTEGKMYITMS